MGGRVSCLAASAAAEIYTLSLHDALPISRARVVAELERGGWAGSLVSVRVNPAATDVGRRGWIYSHRHEGRSEEHTSELQSRENLVCRLLLEKKNISPA